MQLLDITPYADATTEEYAVNNDNFGAPNDAEVLAANTPTFNVDELDSPPLARIVPNLGVDVVAHWYNDYGMAGSSSAVWQDWDWNWASNGGDGVTTKGYDVARRPNLGWYAGDNPKVLDWICYWLAEAGVAAVSLVTPSGLNYDGNWATGSNAQNWIYQLFNNVPNFKRLRFVGWTPDGGGKTLTQYETHNTALASLYGSSDNPYVIHDDGLSLAVVFCFDMEAVRGDLDAFVGSTQTEVWLADLATKMIAQGFDGVCVMARNSGTIGASPAARARLLGNKVLFLNADYESRYGTDASFTNSFANYASSATLPTGRHQVINVVTAAKTVYPHPSTFNLAGSTPALFGQVLRRAVNQIEKSGMRRIITVYNVSEWAEGGPGLIPNRQDGFGYLDQLKGLRRTPPRLWTPKRPGIAVYKGATQSIADSTDVAMSFDSERYDSEALHDASGAPTKLSITKPGWWLLWAWVAFAPNATGYRQIGFRRDSSTSFGIARMAAVNGTDNHHISTSALFYFLTADSAHDFIEVIVRQTSGGNLNVLAGASGAPQFAAIWLGN